MPSERCNEMWLHGSQLNRPICFLIILFLPFPLPTLSTWASSGFSSRCRRHQGWCCFCLALSHLFISRCAVEEIYFFFSAKQNKKLSSTFSLKCVWHISKLVSCSAQKVFYPTVHQYLLALTLYCDVLFLRLDGGSTWVSSYSQVPDRMVVFCMLVINTMWHLSIS